MPRQESPQIDSASEREPLLPIWKHHRPCRQTRTAEQFIRARSYLCAGFTKLGRPFKTLTSDTTRIGELLSLLQRVGPGTDVRSWITIASLLLCIAISRVMTVLQPLVYGRVIAYAEKDSLWLLSSAEDGNQEMWTTLGPWLALGFVEVGVLSPVRSTMTSALQEQMQVKLQIAVHKHVMGLSTNFHEDTCVSDLAFRIIQGSSSIGSLFDAMVLDLLPTLFDLTVSIFLLRSRFGLGPFSVGVSTFSVSLVASATMLRRMNEARKGYFNCKREEQNAAHRTIEIWREATIYNQLDEEHLLFADRSEAAEIASKRLQRVSNITNFATSAVQRVGLGIVCMFICDGIIAGTATVGDFVTACTYWNSLMGPLTSLILSHRQLSAAWDRLQGLLQLFQSQPTIRDNQGAKKLNVSFGRIEFDRICFSYGKGTPQIIHAVSVSIEGGQHVAFVGQSGSGKTTLLNLLARFYDVDGGCIRIDGQDIRDVTLHSLREAIGFMHQDPKIINGTIRENVGYGKQDATDEEVTEACRAAAIHDQILEMTHGYNTIVGENGVKLSGGQKQRIAIARLFLRDPKIIILDEATSAMDTATEARIQESLTRLFRGRTVLMIAHRLSTVKKCDMICVMDGGQIQEASSHAKLLACHGRYASLWAKQS